MSVTAQPKLNSISELHAFHMSRSQPNIQTGTVSQQFKLQGIVNVGRETIHEQAPKENLPIQVLMMLNFETGPGIYVKGKVHAVFIVFTNDTATPRTIKSN